MARPERVALFSLVLSLAPWVGATAAWAQDRTYEWQWRMHPMSWMWGAWGVFMMLGMLLFWGLVIAMVVVGIRWLGGQGSRFDRAHGILRERYARGEIDKEEFEAKQRDLR